MDLSVIVLTSPGRESNLQACLQAIERQTAVPDEIILIDDGSEGGERVAKSFDLPLAYHWRPNDARLAWSRNQGARMASRRGLVFVDSDAILNPLALASYAAALDELPEHAIFGYHANVREATDLYPSAILNGLTVHAEDQRFPWIAGKGLTVHPHLLQRPMDFAWSCNFALRAEVFWAVGGFAEERFSGWGYEDVDLGYRLSDAGAAIYFSLDAWAETLPHSRSWDAVHKDKNKPLISPQHYHPRAVEILHDRDRAGLVQAWEKVYLPAKARPE